MDSQLYCVGGNDGTMCLGIGISIGIGIKRLLLAIFRTFQNPYGRLNQ